MIVPKIPIDRRRRSGRGPDGEGGDEPIGESECPGAHIFAVSKVVAKVASQDEIGGTGVRSRKPRAFSVVPVEHDMEARKAKGFVGW